MTLLFWVNNMYEYGEEKEQETDINVVQYEKKK
jgi:hypothetical protein